MKPTVPRPRPNLRQVLQERPGWYMNRGDYVPRRSEDILKQARNFQVWKKVRGEPYTGVLCDHVWVQGNGEETWYWCGDGPVPLHPFTGEPIEWKPVNELVRLGRSRLIAYKD